VYCSGQRLNDVDDGLNLDEEIWECCRHSTILYIYDRTETDDHGSRRCKEGLLG